MSVPAIGDAKLTEALVLLDNCGTTGELSDCLLAALQSFGLSSCTKPAAYKKEIQNTISFIQENFAGKLTLDDIAEHVNLNKSYLCRLFKLEVGVSIFGYINQVRMERSARLLEKGITNNIKAVAAEGIDDPFYFARRFKEFFRKTPSEYLKEKQQALF